MKVVTPERWSRVKTIVGAALECPVEEHASFLDEACANDRDLRSEVDSLIAAYRGADYLSQPHWMAALGILEDTPKVIGPYRLERELGSGGMGQVWLAEQTEPVKRKVALKIIRASLRDPLVAQRFFAERQSLALMNHPAIARIFDAGATPTGQPYLVMEYVDGLPITDYCDRHQLGLAERLRLFQLICDGVQHAHQKAVIHRDLKPSNILVTVVDGAACPRIIDFGVAKGIPRSADLKTMFTQIGAIIGTLGYISPEQSQLNSNDIDTRTDVYSLGVILYELLAGVLPFDVKSIDSYDMLNRLRDAEPPRPSIRLRHSGELSVDIARRRKLDADSLVRRLRGDLDAITLKALEHDRARRYSTPLSLSNDIEAYLSNAPVSAQTPSVSYRARKYVRRHRLGAAIAAAGAVVLVVFVVAQAIQTRHAWLERDRADRIAAYMTNIFRVSDPSESRGSTVTAREVLDRSAAQIKSDTTMDKAVQAQLMQVMAETYFGLGLYRRSQDLAEQALNLQTQISGPDASRTLDLMQLLGKVLSRQGHDAQADALLRKVIDRQIKVLGADSPATLATENALALALIRQAHNAEAAALQRDVVEKENRILGPDNSETLRATNTLATALQGESRFGEAEKMFRQLLDNESRVLGTDHPDTLKTMHNLANMLSEQGRYPEAEALYRKTLEIQHRILGADHPETASTMTTLANTLVLQSGRKEEAEALYRESLIIQRRAVGAESLLTTRAVEGLANLLASENHNTEAEAMFRELLDIRRRTRGTDDTDVLLTQYNLALVLDREKRFSEAEALLAKTLRQQTQVLDKDDPDTLATKTSLGATLIREGRPREALQLAQEAFDAQRRILGPQHHDTQDSLLVLAKAMARSGRYVEAQGLYSGTIRQLERLPSANLPQAWYNFACMAAASGHRGDALEYLERAVQEGFSDADALEGDEDLMSVRPDPRYEAVVSLTKKRAELKKAAAQIPTSAH